MKCWLKRWLCLLLAAACVGMAGCRSSEEPSASFDPVSDTSSSSETEYTKGSAEMKLSGTFIQSWLCSAWSDERWEQELSMLKELGMEYIVLGDSAVKNTSGKWYSFYPSELDGLKEGYGGVDVIDNALRNCQKYGFKVFIGVGLDEKWWDSFVKDPDWLYSAMEQSGIIADEIYSNYHAKYADAFHGWYWPPEIWNSELFKSTSAVREESIQVLAKGMSIIRDHLTAIDDSLPMMFSPFVNRSIGSAEDNYLFWRDLISQVSFLEGDIICPMDSVGAGGCPVDYLDAWTASYSKAVAETGKIRFWSNCENFDYSKGGEPISCSMDRFSRQMEIVAKYCETTITFAYSHYYSSYNTLEGFHNAYSYYLKNGELEKEKPSAPGNVSLRSENGVVVLNWDASNDNLGVVGYNVYRNGELLENICAQRGDNAVKVPEIDTTTTDWDAEKIDGSVIYGIAAFDASGNESEIVTVTYR